MSDNERATIYNENTLPLNTYCRLRNSVGWLNFSESQAAAALSSSLYTVTALTVEGQAVGMGRLIGDGLYDMIVDVVVHPAYQGNGIGSTIMRKLLSYAEEMLPDGGRLSVQLVAEKGKEAFYENLGFRRIPHEHCGSGMRKVIYKK